MYSETEKRRLKYIEKKMKKPRRKKTTLQFHRGYLLGRKQVNAWQYSLWWEDFIWTNQVLSFSLEIAGKPVLLFFVPVLRLSDSRKKAWHVCCLSWNQEQNDHKIRTEINFWNQLRWNIAVISAAYHSQLRPVLCPNYQIELCTHSPLFNSLFC